jgi:hypothetical protein
MYLWRFADANRSLSSSFFLSVESEDTMAPQPERIASLETAAAIAKWVLGIFIPLVIGWGAYITMNVIAMKQQLADGGNTKLVTELKAPKSPDQLRANLSMVSAQIQTAKANGTKPDAKKVQALSTALSQVVQRDPELPEAWQTAFQLVSYRFQLAQIPPDSELRNCLDAPKSLTEFAGTLREEGDNVAKHRPGHFQLVSSNCVLNLDSNSAFESTSGWQFFREVNERAPGNGVHFDLFNAIVTYSGNGLIPFDGLKCTNCVFELKPSSAIPPRRGQALTDQLLTADLSKVDVNLRSGL